MCMHMELDFSKQYKGFTLRVQYKGDSNCVGILGASGCGKSMTLKAIAGIVTPDQGRIVIDGQVFFDSAQKINLSPQERKIGYLFQNYALFQTMTVTENIAAGLRAEKKQKIKERVAVMIKRFALTGLEERYPRELSGGQQQRVALARIMAYEPRLILLDEPFSALDSFLKERLKLEMKQLLKYYVGGMILVTHSRDEIYEFTEELLIMSSGSLIEIGKTREIFKKPQFMESARLTGCKNISSAVMLDENHVYAVDWDIIFETDKITINPVNYVAIRSHHLHLSASKETNRINYDIIDVSETPFELTFVIKKKKSNGGSLLWKLHKEEAKELAIEKTCCLYVQTDNVMALG